jgi:hypothetical protein
MSLRSGSGQARWDIKVHFLFSLHRKREDQMTHIKRMFVAATLFAATMAAPAFADTVLAPGSSWEYTFSNPTASSNWNTTTGGWSVGNAPFGNCFNCGYGSDFNWQTYWTADGSDGNDLWVRKAVDFTGFDLGSATWGLGVDNGYSLYVNGQLISSGNAEGFTSRWEYSGSFGNSLHSGVNFIAVALEDHGGLTAFDMQINAAVAPVPEPETYAMMLAGLGLLGMMARRRRQGR